ncbi:hypothetical protein HDV03_003925 [Kappamyces sp. JEL0829]|nr:hypothetical protein HDV03_003925 [Kappamyces sp. JEL0829]
MTQRRLPNILITGTPGTGKTTTSQLVASCLGEGFQLVSVGDLVKEKGLHEGFDEEFSSYLIDEDRVVDELEDRMATGGVVVDHHTSAFFPERWFDLVVCLTCDNGILYDRLEQRCVGLSHARNYAANKIQENVECEIMQVVLSETMESYKKEIVAVLPSNTLDEMEANVERIEAWTNNYLASHSL